MQIVKWNKGPQEIVDFYKTCDYVYHPKEGETILAAIENVEIVGVVRLSKEEGVIHLRGMQIKEQSRRKGIGTKMLKKVEEIIEKEACYLVGYPHLRNFYGQIGFREIERKDAPKSVQERFDNAKEKFPETKFNIMARG